MGKTNKMKSVLIIAIVWMLSSAALEAAQPEFDDLVRAISDEFHTRPMHIPFFGLVNLATFVARPGGVKHINLALFENLPANDRSIRRLSDALRSANRNWRPFVQVHGKGETVEVYMAQEGNDCKLLVATIETGEATVVELKLNPKAVQVWLREPEKSALHHHDRGEAY